MFRCPVRSAPDPAATEQRLSLPAPRTLPPGAEAGRQRINGLALAPDGSAVLVATRAQVLEYPRLGAWSPLGTHR